MPAWIASLLASTDPARRRPRIAALVGLIGGAFSAIVKFGWEVPFPPRTPEIRSETNPPQAMLEWFGMSHETSHAMVSFNNNQLPIMSFAVHFSFAIVFGLVYCIAAEYVPRITMWQGAVFGTLVYIGAHVIVMPILGWAPSPFPWLAGAQTWSEHFSEFFGRIVWMWSIEIVRHDLRGRITHEPSAEIDMSS